MPELPEVETICRGIAPHLEGQVIQDIVVRNARLRQPVPEDFVQRMRGVRCQHVMRRAKYILAECSHDQTLIIHLGMSGNLLYYATPPQQHHKHDHVLFYLSSGAVIAYRDPRRFGVVTEVNTNNCAESPLLCHLGAEPLSPDWQAESLYSYIQAKKAPIKNVIMDQRVVVGVGNIYACEALFRAEIHPSSSACLIPYAKIKQLVASVKEVLQEAINAGGSSLRDYVSASGEAGYFQHSFQVYGRQNLPCLQCNTPILRIQQAGRSSFYCPSCQK